MTAIEDEETQKNGIISVQYKVGQQEGLRPTRHLLWKGAQGQRALPIKITGFHLCFGRQSLPFVSLLKLVMEYQTSNRIRVHEGTQTELLHRLATFGIPGFAIPLAANGDTTISYHLDWLRQRKNLAIIQQHKQQQQQQLEEEEARATTTNLVHAVNIPSRRDIFLGRGKRSQSNPGNIRLNLLLEESIERYDRSTRAENRAFIRSIIDQIKKKDGGRFLKPIDDDDGSTWVEVDDEVATQKIIHDFRTVRYRRKKMQQQQQQESLSESSRESGTKRSVHSDGRRDRTKRK